MGNVVHVLQVVREVVNKAQRHGLAHTAVRVQVGLARGVRRCLYGQDLRALRAQAALVPAHGVVGPLKARVRGLPQRAEARKRQLPARELPQRGAVRLQRHHAAWGQQAAVAHQVVRVRQALPRLLIARERRGKVQDHLAQLIGREVLLQLAGHAGRKHRVRHPGLLRPLRGVRNADGLQVHAHKQRARLARCRLHGRGPLAAAHVQHHTVVARVRRRRVKRVTGLCPAPRIRGGARLYGVRVALEPLLEHEVLR